MKEPVAYADYYTIIAVKESASDGSFSLFEKCDLNCMISCGKFGRRDCI